jgi:hypothetical protein
MAQAFAARYRRVESEVATKFAGKRMESRLLAVILATAKNEGYGRLPRKSIGGSSRRTLQAEAG